jgi:hypothetical protein
MKIPDYYKNYKKPAGTSEPSPPQLVLKGTPPEIEYQANSFTINLYEEWQDKTVFTITGPVTDGVQHNITIMVDHEVEVDNLRDFTDLNVETLENELKGCRMLKKGQITLNNGLPAYKAIFSWYPTEELRIYQEQIYVLVEKTGYKLTATFTKKTRKTLGPQVERMMLSFNPVKPSKEPNSNR